MARGSADALEEVGFSRIQDAIRARDVATLKSLWNKLVRIWDDRTFYDFVARSDAFSKLSFNAVWGIERHFGGRTRPDNPGPGDAFAEIGPMELAD